MKQEQIKELLERIRSNKNNETNELVVAAEEASLNTTPEATMSVASARALTTTTISANNYLSLESYDENGNACEEPIIGNYLGTMYTLVGSVDMSALLAANNISASDLTHCYLTLFGDAGYFSWGYSIYDINGNYVGYNCGSGMQVYVSLKDVYDASGAWFFVLEPTTGSDIGLHFSGVADLEVSYNANPLTGISVTTEPIKTEYVAGDKFDKTGMVVTATYSNGTTQVVTNYTCPTSSLAAGATSVTISYTETGVTKTTTQAITVTAPGKEGYFGNRNISVSNYGENPMWNIQTMGLRYLQQGISIGMNSYTIGANLVYDSQMKDRLQDMCKGMPKGWKLDAQQFIVEDGKDDDNASTYKYIDGQGYVHTFEKYLGSTSDYYDTEGAGLVLMVNNGYVIKDQDDNEMHFDTNGRLVKTVSGKDPDNIKHYQYDSSGRLTKIYDNRKATRYVTFTYSSNLLRKIKTYEDSVLFETLTLAYTNNNITGVEKDRGDHYKEMNSFTYDENGKLNLIVDLETKDAVQVNHTFDEFIRNEYIIQKMSKGYWNGNSFEEKTYEQWSYTNTLNDFNTYCEVTTCNEKGIRMARKTDSEGNMMASLERMTDSYKFKTLQREVGAKLTCGANANEVFNAEGTRSLASGSNAATEIPLNLESNSAANLAGYRYFNLSFWLKYHSEGIEKLYACVSYKVNGTEYKAYQPIDVKMIYVWQKVSIPIDLQNTNGNFTDMKLTFRTFNTGNTEMKRNVSGEVSCFRMNAGESRKVKINEKNFDGIKKIVAVSNNATETIFVKAKDHKFTEGDFMRSVESYNLKRFNKANDWDFYYDNGKKRIRNCTEVKIYIDTEPEDFITLASQAKQDNADNYLWRMESHSADDRVISKQYSVYNTTGCLSITKTKIGNGDEQTTEQQSHYKFWDREITEENGATVKREYFDDGNLKKETLVVDDENTILVYEATRDATGEYITQERGSFDRKNYTFSDFALDKMERSSYNGITYKESYGYDGFKEDLETLTAYFGTTQKAENQMDYWEGELSNVTDGKVSYNFDVDKNGDSNTVTFSVADGSAWKTLEETETDHDANTVTHTYYRTDDTVTDTFVYTANDYGKPTAISYGGVQKVTYNYTNAGESQAAWLLASVEDGFAQRTYAYTYNADGSQKSVGFNGFKVTKVNESEKEYEIGTSNPTKLKQTVTSGARIYKIANTVNDVTTPVFDRYYTYDNFGRMQKKQVLELANAEENTYTLISETELGYTNDHMLPISETHQRNDGTMYEVTYAYDSRGNLQSISDVYGTTTYAYDALNRLTQEDSKTYLYDDNGRMSSFNGNALTYDNRGRLIQFGNTALTYDNYGNRLTKGSTNYTWTRGRLLASVGGITFEYDAKGRRTKKGSTEYYYDGDRLIAELRPDDTLYYFYDESGVCGMCHNEVNYEFVRNIFGDVVAIYREDGVCAASYAYDAWGNCSVVINENNVANINPFRYRGYYFDTESGLYYLMSRYYDPSIGQFISMDTQEYLKPDTIGGVDLYAYCGNNPVMRQDPTGHDWWNPAKWNWGLIADIAVTVVAIAAGVAAGIATATYTGSVKLGIAAGVATAGAVNNAANAIYYNYISDEQSAINEPSGESGEEESSHYVNNGYITRWERLDYTKAQTQEACYNVNAWRFYSEYNFHMYMWFATGWAHKRNIPFISDWAGSASYAEVSTDKWEEIDGKWSWRNWCYIALGLLGL